MEISIQPFGQINDHLSVKLYTLRNSNDFEVKISDYGGTVVSLLAPDQMGVHSDVILGYDSLEE